MFSRRRAKARPVASSVETADGPIALDQVLAISSIDERMRPAAGLYPGQVESPPINWSGCVVIHKRPDGSTGRTVVPCSVPELLARIAAGKA